MRVDQWTCDVCGAIHIGTFPIHWITQSTCVGSGYLDLLADRKNFCTPHCAGESLTTQMVAAARKSAA